MKNNDEYLIRLENSARALSIFLTENLHNFEEATVIILGTSGPKGILEKIKNPVTEDYSRFGFSDPSAEGHAGKLYLGTLNNEKVIILAGRLHFNEGYSMGEVVHMVRSLAIIGLYRFVLTNASGYMNDSKLQVGDIAIISDHVNNMGDNPLAGFKYRDWPNFIDCSNLYDKDWREFCKDQAFHQEIKVVSDVVYTAVKGPNFETPAEVRKLRREADLVGMSTIPEVLAIKQFDGIALVISLATNPAAGIVKGEISHADNLTQAKKRDEDLSRLIIASVKYRVKKTVPAL